MRANVPRASLGQGLLAGGVQPPGTILTHIVEFIVDRLPRWRDHPDRPAAHSEPQLASQLCNFLNSEARVSLDVIQFSTEVPDPVQAGRKLDIAAQPMAKPIWVEGRRYTLFDVLLPIECKRLPTPPDRDPREYVTVRQGTTGGIQRFKLGAHGAAHALAVIIAFIQEDDARTWLRRINGWLAEMAKGDPFWAGEQLRAVASGAHTNVVRRFRSGHRRLRGSGDVELWHLWIAMAVGSEKARGRPGGRGGGDKQTKLPFHVRLTGP